MANYILNKNKQDSESGRNNELHNEDTCIRLPNYENRLLVGIFYDCQSAKAEAIRKYPQYARDIDGCYFCCKPCHSE